MAIYAGADEIPPFQTLERLAYDTMKLIQGLPPIDEHIGGETQYYAKVQIIVRDALKHAVEKGKEGEW